MKPWREVAVPHADVRKGTFQQAEFAADLSAVAAGKAPAEYGDAAAFYARTYITEGLRGLLTAVALRLNGRGGEPIIQLQTAFGGGKTHAMLAVYHLARRTCPLGALPGIPTLIEAAGLMDVPHAQVAVLDGHAHAPGQPWTRAAAPQAAPNPSGRVTVNTLWGELAWQLGGADGYAAVAAADRNGTSPGKEVLAALLQTYAPAVILIDELLAYIRQFPEGARLSGGTYDSNISFLQALTEAVKLVPAAILLASLPESEVEAGSSRGVTALRALEKVFGRVHALWRPVATEEAFEIVRRRLFETPADSAAAEHEAARAAVCRAFADAYVQEGARLPAETQEARYRERLLHAYPIHPEVFDRLYEEWSSIDGFQRTRGVLKLMAKVIYRLWTEGNTDLMILPGSLPLDDPDTRGELTYYLPQGWDPVVERDIDGPRAETTELENKEPRFGAIGAARRVARTIFLGSAPASVTAAAGKGGNRGLDRARVLLGCLQPGQGTSTYGDALNRLADRLHYLNLSGDKSAESTRFWFDTRANLRREMEERKGRFSDLEVRQRLQGVLKGVVAGSALFDGVHIFTPHGDVPDDALLRLVVLGPEVFYTPGEPRAAKEAARDYVRSHGVSGGGAGAAVNPRYRGNRLLFLAADYGTLGRLRDAVRAALAWGDIVADIREFRLNVDQVQKRQAEKELEGADKLLPRVACECYKWLLCPTQYVAADPQPDVEAFALNTGAGALGAEIDRVCGENELVIKEWSPLHLRGQLERYYWKPDRSAVGALQFWEDSQRYLYLPRLRNRAVLDSAIQKGAVTRDFFATAYGEEEGRFLGFQFASAPVQPVQIDKTLLLIEPRAAGAYAEALRAAEEAARRAEAKAAQEKIARDPRDGENGGPYSAGAASAAEAPAGSAGKGGSSGASSDASSPSGQGGLFGGGQESAAEQGLPGRSGASRAPAQFVGSVDVKAAGAKLKLSDIADEIIALLARDPHAEVLVTVEIQAGFPQGVDEGIKRAVLENAASLGFKFKDWV